jgi:F-type H+-transporting ATPase subunit epsilon
VVEPDRAVLDAEVESVIAEGIGGSFGLMPRHIDLVAPLVPGLLTYRVDGEERFLGVDEGVLVKRGEDVMVSSRNVIEGADLGAVRRSVIEDLRQLDEEEVKARAALARMEADFVRRFLELERA